MNLDALTLLLLFQVKHFIADYPLQTPFMLQKGAPSWKFVKPLAAHSALHAVLTGILLIAYDLWLGPGRGYTLGFTIGMMALDFVIHFVMDRIKAGPKYMGAWKPDNKLFWWALGFDQLVHHATGIVIVFLAVNWGRF